MTIVVVLIMLSYACDHDFGHGTKTINLTILLSFIISLPIDDSA